MVFSSLTFLFLFLPAVLLVYFLVPKHVKNAVLFCFSLLFYAWGEPVYIGLMLFSTVLDYCCGRAVEAYRGTRKAKIALGVSIAVNLGLLCLFKYADFLLTTVNALFGCRIPLLNLPLPIGISFYTFQTMSYTIDVYRGDAKAQHNILSFGAYVTLFPQLIAGPIVRYQTIADQIDHRTHSFDRFGDGAKRFVCGLAKKILLANNIGLLWASISASSASDWTVVSAWFFLLRYLKRLPALIGHLYTIFIVLIGWVFFGFESIQQGFAFLGAMFGAVPFCNSDTLYQLLSYAPLLAVCAVASTPLLRRCYERINARGRAPALCTTDLAGMACLICLSVAYLISGSYNPFLYFRF